jgi:hypothetical protein
MNTSCFSLSAAAFCAAMGWGFAAHAGFTEISEGTKEPNLQQILSHVLGGDFVADGNNFTNGIVTAQRVDDNNDQQFSGHVFDAKAVARFSGYTQAFGLFDQSFHKSFDVTGTDYNVTGSATLDLTHGSAVGRAGDSGIDSSVDSQNGDGRDHLVTYKIAGESSSETTYMLFWEDLDFSATRFGRRTASDFNDVVIEMTADDHGGNLIPLPPALASGATMLGAGLIKLLLPRRRTTA